MKPVYFIAALVATVTILWSCDEDSKNETDGLSVNSALLTELSDEEYPDNPDISVRHSKYSETEMGAIEFIRNGEGFDIVITPSKKEDDTVRMNGIHLMEFIPTIPKYAKNDKYMSLISVVIQEWNRNQVKWVDEELLSVIPEDFEVNGERITRIDLARNCLNSYLWELFFYADVDGNDVVFYHGWFDFPHDLYKELFEERNGEKFDDYARYMEDWKDPSNEKLDLSLIRKVITSKNVRFVNHDEEMYPISGERKKKEMEVIYPEKYSKMSDFHTDSALFATFSPPGYYTRSDPRHTELGRFHELENVSYRKTASEGIEHDELHLVFKRRNGEVTRLVFGGINFEDLPVLEVKDANAGSQYSMGIGNHPFYEDCKAHDALCCYDNPYFGVLLDKDGKWLDSHAIGIDGPLLHIDKDNPNIVHVWLLSFERHALVGHYEIDLSKVR